MERRTAQRVSLVLLFGIARTGLAASAVSDEAGILDLLERSRYHDAQRLLDGLPGDSPYPALAGPAVKRLVALKERIVSELNRKAQRVEVRDVHPDPNPLRGGRIVGATTQELTVEEDGISRRVIWSGLPPELTLRLARRCLGDAPDAAPGLRDLEAAMEAVGVPIAPGSQSPGGSGVVPRVRHALAVARDLDKAREALAAAPRSETESPWTRLARLWVDRLSALRDGQAKRRQEAARTLPPGSTIPWWEDFEGGPELLSRGWGRGAIARPPDGSGPSNRWVHRAVAVNRALVDVDISQMFHVHNLPEGLNEPVFVLNERTYLTARVWVDNVKTVLLALSYNPQAEGRYSRIEIPVDRSNAWVQIQVRLDDLSRHRNYRMLRGFPLLKLGDPVHLVAFSACWAEPGKGDGCFYLDDVRVYTVPASTTDLEPQ
jgi:hypothetical protein